MVTKILRIILPIIILAGGTFSAFTLMGKRTGPMMRPPMRNKITPLVETVAAKAHTGTMSIETYGTTEAAAKANISSEVSGRVIWINPDMAEGKKISKGARLFTIDPTEYELRAQQAKASLIEAQYNLDLVKAKQAAAIKEFQSYQKLDVNNLLKANDQAPQISRLAKYEPQVESALGTLESAKAGLQLAELNLKRTITVAPMTGHFSDVSVASGQLISTNQTVAGLIKSTPVILKTPVALSDLRWLSFEAERGGAASQESEAIVSKKIGSVVHQWHGKVKRQLREISASGRKAVLIVEVENTLSDQGMDLPIGLFVDVTLQGKIGTELIEIPNDILRENATVWVVNSDNQLEIKELVIEKQTKSSVFVSRGITPNDKLIASSLTAPIPGMNVRIMDEPDTMVKQTNEDKVRLTQLRKEGNSGEMRIEFRQRKNMDNRAPTLPDNAKQGNRDRQSTGQPATPSSEK